MKLIQFATKLKITLPILIAVVFVSLSLITPYHALADDNTIFPIESLKQSANNFYLETMGHLLNANLLFNHANNGINEISEVAKGSQNEIKKIINKTSNFTASIVTAIRNISDFISNPISTPVSTPFPSPSPIPTLTPTSTSPSISKIAVKQAANGNNVTNSNQATVTNQTTPQAIVKTDKAETASNDKLLFINQDTWIGTDDKGNLVFHDVNGSKTLVDLIKSATSISPSVLVQSSPGVFPIIQPQLTTGADRFSANYLNLSKDATINGGLTVNSGTNLNSLSVSGNTSLTGETIIGGALTVTGNTSLSTLTLSGTATSTFASPISSNLGDLIIAGNNSSNILLNPYGGNVGIGTTNPAYYLEVAGTTKTDDIITKGPRVDVRAYGAKGDGVTDSTTAITNALAALPSTGGVLYFPKGTYLTGDINISTSNVIVEGDGYGSIIKSKSGTTNSIYLEGDFQSIKDIKIDGNGNASQLNLNGSYLNLDHVYILGHTTYNIKVTGGNNYWVRNSIIIGKPISASISGTSGNNFKIDNSYMNGNGSNECVILDGSGHSVTNSVLESYTSAMRIAQHKTSRAININNNYFETAYGAGEATIHIYATGGSYTGTVTGNFDGPSSNTNYSLQFDWGQGWLISGNEFDRGIDVGADALLSNVIVGNMGKITGGTNFPIVNSGSIEFDGSGSYEAADLGWSSNVFNINVTKGGTGVYRDFAIDQNGGEVVRINSGNVGIGTTGPSYKLDVAGIAQFQDYARASYFTATSTTATSTFNGAFTAGNNAGLTVNMAAPLGSLYINPAGNVGIGTTNPASTLEVAGTGITLGGVTRTTWPTGSGTGFGVDMGTYAYYMGGNVGIGTTTPNNILTLAAATTPALGFTTNLGLSGWTMGIDTADGNKFKIASSTAVGTNTRLTIDGNGNVGIGTTAPRAELQVGSGPTGHSASGIYQAGSLINEFDGTTYFDGLLYTYGSGNYFTGAGTSKFYDDHRVVFGTNNNYAMGYNPTSGTWQFINGITLNTNVIMAINSSGNVGIGTTTPTTNLTISKAGTVANVAVTNGWLCVDNNGGCVGGTAGTIYYVASAVGNSDVSENYFSQNQLEPGDIVMATGGIDIDKATSTSQTIIGVISSAPAMIMGYDQNNASSTYPVALVGRVPVKVSLENGPIAVGDRISASSIPGVGKRASSTEATVGIALEPYNGTISSEQDTGEILVFINLGQPQLAAKQGTGDLASMVMANSDINMNGFSLLNVKSIAGMNGLWKIDENGNITAQSVKAQSVESVKGFTTYDTETGQPFCIRITNGQVVSLPGSCSYIPVNSAPTTISETSALPTDSTGSPQAATSSVPALPAGTSEISATTTPSAAEPSSSAATITFKIQPISPVATTSPMVESGPVTTTTTPAIIEPTVASSTTP